MRRIGLLGTAIAFARSPQGQRAIAQARQKYDTPVNRAKLRAAVGDLRNRKR